MRIRLILPIFIFCMVGINTSLEAATYEQIQFLIAVRNGDIGAVEEAIYQEGMDVNFTHEGFYPLHYAALERNVAIW